MRMRTSRWMVLLACALGCGGSPASPQPGTTSAVPSASATYSATAATPPPDPLAGRKIRLDDAGLGASVLRVVDGATVVAIGEQTHGSEANARARVDLTRLLIEKHDVRVVALEADYVEVLRIDAYVQGGPGEPEALLGQQRAGWIWNKPALRELLVWLRDLNATRGEGKRVHLVGLDMQTGPAIVSAIVDTLEPRGAEAALRKKISKMDACDDAKLAALLPELDKLVARRASLGPLTRSLRQCQGAWQQGAAGTAAREQGMADNVIAAAEAGGGRRVVVLAHNAHVAKVPLVPTDASSMGSVLAAKAGRRYVAIGTVLGDGDFRGYRLDPEKGRSNAPEMLPLGTPPDDSVEGWLKDDASYFLPLAGSNEPPRKLRVIGASYAPGYADKFLYPVSVERAFDAVFYLPHA